VKREMSSIQLAIRWILIVCCVAATGGAVKAQGHRVEIFSDDQEYFQALKDVQTAGQIAGDQTLLDAHVNKALGAEFDQITSLTAVYCRKTTAITTIQNSISKLLRDEGFTIRSEWDPTFGTLRATLEKHGLINTRPPEYQRVTIKIQVGGTQILHAFTMDYAVLSSPQEHNNSWTDVSLGEESKAYIDELRVKIRESVEPALKINCAKATAKDPATLDQAVQTIATKLQLKPAEVQALKEAVREQDE
jgi:hypothetical protein